MFFQKPKKSETFTEHDSRGACGIQPACVRGLPGAFAWDALFEGIGIHEAHPSICPHQAFHFAGSPSARARVYSRASQIGTETKSNYAISSKHRFHLYTLKMNFDCRGRR